MFIVYTLIVLVFLVLLLMQVHIKNDISIVVDLLNVKLEYTAKIWKITLVKLKFDSKSAKDEKYNFVVFGKRVDTTKIEQSMKKEQADLKSSLSMLKEVFSAFTKSIDLQKMDIHILIGILEDAALCAIVSGTLGMLLYPIAHKVRNFYHGSDVNASIIPLFNDNAFKINIFCIFSIKIGKILKNILKIIINTNKGGKNNGKTSNREYYANYNGEYS